MAQMGNYCCAYFVRDLSAFDGWKPDLTALRAEAPEGDPEGEPVPRTELRDDDVLYLHEDFSVTDGYFLDEHLVFKGDAPGWETFCTSALQFAVPEDLATATEV